MKALCDKCPANGSSCKVPPTPADSSAKLIICGEAPGATELRLRRPFVGRSGDYLDLALRRINLQRSAVHITNALLCRLPETASNSEWRLALECCRPRLEAELNKLGCNIVLSLGARALETLTGKRSIFPWAGAPLPGISQKTILPTLHPAFILRPQGWDYSPVFFVHIARAYELAVNGPSEPCYPKFFLWPDREASQALIDIHKAGKPIGFDVETMGVDPLKDVCMCVGISNEDLAVSVPWESYLSGGKVIVPYLSESFVGRQIAKRMKLILQDSKIEKIAQNGPHDILTLERLGIKVKGYKFDTMTAHMLIAPGRRHDLGWICCELNGMPRWKEEKHTASDEKGAMKFSKRQQEELRLYNAKDCYMTLLAARDLGSILSEDPPLKRLFNSHAMPAVKIAINMQRRGFKIDIAEKARLQKLYKSRFYNQQAAIRKIAKKFWASGGSFNPRSPQQLRKLFFDKLQARKLPGRGVSLDKEVLAHYKTKAEKPIVRALADVLLKYRHADKMLGTYINGLPLDCNNIIHAKWKPGKARTMRWASSPNLQNIPYEMRSMFISHAADGWLVRGDYDQLELRIIALFSGDKPLIDTFNSGADPHAINAKEIFGLRDVSLVSKNQRNVAKMAVYQMCYGGSVKALHEKITLDFPDVTFREIELIHRRWFSVHGRLGEWHEELLKTAKAKGYVEAPLTKHRRNFYIEVEDAKVFNYPVQHTAADIMNKVIKKVNNHMDWKHTSIVGQIHDELIIEGADRDSLVDILRTEMPQTIEYKGNSMRFPTGIKIGRNWRDCEELNF